MDEKLSYVKTSTEKPLSSSTIMDILDETVAAFKNETFVKSIHENKSITYKELIEEADKLALGLYKIGLKTGDKIGIIINNCIEMFIINVACIKGGFVSVNLNPASQPRELEYYVKETKINCLISVDKYKVFSVIDVLKKVIPEFENNENGIIQSQNIPSIKSVIIISDIVYKGTLNYESVKLLGKDEPTELIRVIQNKISCYDPVTILFTSGTTGNPKALELTHHQLYNCLKFTHIRIGLNEKQYKFAFYLPMFHLFGILFNLLTLNSGATLVLPSYYYNREENLKAISEEKCTFLMGSPTMFDDLVTIQRSKNLSLSVEKIISGASVCPDKLVKDIKEVLNVKKIGIAYGSSEALLLTFNWLNEKEKNASSMLGEFIEHLEAKVVDSSDNIVPLGIVGHLYVKGYSVIKKYINKNLLSSEDFDEDGWYKTGDAIYLDENKKAHISGRMKEIINRGGEKISPAEVEQCLEAHPNILEVCIVGTYHERLGEEVCACLRIKPESTITLDDIKSFCKGKLSYYKIPSKILFIDNFPKTNLGKLQRVKLSKQINNNLFARIGIINE